MSANARGVPIDWAPIMMVTVAHITPACARGQSLQDDHVPAQGAEQQRRHFRSAFALDHAQEALASFGCNDMRHLDS